MRDNPITVALLLANGAQPDKANVYGITPLAPEEMYLSFEPVREPARV